MKYRKHKKIIVLGNGKEARINKSDVPNGDYTIKNGDSELDVVRETSKHIFVDTLGETVDTLSLHFDQLPEEEPEPFDYTPIQEAVKHVEDAIYATEADVDVKPIVDALERVRMAIDAQILPETIDYTPTLQRLVQATTERFDASEITALLNEIVNKETPKFEIPANLINDNRVKVEVDRIGMGGGASTGRLENILQTGTAVKAADSPSVDAFGRWRVSNTETIFDSKQLYDSQPLFWDDQEVSGSGTGSTHSTAKAATTLSVSDATAGLRVRQTFMRFNYQPGKSQRVLLTCANIAASTGITKGFGYGDDNNGLFLVNDEGTMKFIRRTSTSGSAVDNETEVSMTLPDGSALDLTKTFILDIDFEWLGVGRVRAGLVQGVQIEYFYEFTGVNNLNVVYMSNPNLPLRYWIENNGNGGADTFDHICGSVMSEGGVQKLGVLQHEDSAKVTYTTAGTRYIAMAGRLKSTHLSLSIDIENVSASIFSNDYGHWEFVAGGTPSETLTFTGKTNSGMEIFKGDGDQTLTGGQEIDGRWLSTASSVSFDTPNAIRPGSAIDGTPQVWYLVFIPDTNNVAFASSVTWRELL